MVEGKGQFEWARTANLMALHVNMNLPKGKARVDPNIFNPFIRKKKKPKIILSVKDSMDILEKVFCKNAK